MSKDPSGFLRKVVRFVANPTTDWADLDAPPPESDDGDYAKTEIKAMIERKRRNDFVRKRELDMLRKIRREGLSQDSALALGSNMDPDSRPQHSGGARSDITVKAKIDEIELQMVGGNGRQAPPGGYKPAANPSVNGPLLDLPTTTPNTLTSPATLPMLREEDRHDDLEISQAVLDAARHGLNGAPAQPFSLGLNGDADVHVREVVHDPDLDEAVIAFANADFDQSERSLLELVHPGATRHDQPETWLVLFDLYRAIDLPHKFENLAMAYAQKFGVSAPQWYSFPEKVTSFLARKERHAAGIFTRPAPLEPVSSAPEGSIDFHHEEEEGGIEGWVAGATLDADNVGQLRIAMLQMPRPWTMDWRLVQRVTPEGAALLSTMLKTWALEAPELVWTGADHLMNVLAEAAPTGLRDADPSLWMLRLDLLRLINRPVDFDEVAIDYCVTYEQSPPSWEPVKCRVRIESDVVHTQTRPLTHVSEVTTSFVESRLADDEVEFIQVATLELSGQLVGDIGHTLSQLDNQLSASVTLEIDCSHLLRVDFIAAGDLLNWVLARRAEDRQVIFKNPHRLIALFFGAMGINEHARVQLSQH
jgi:ABC-type transporter Mla MlaB component